MAAVVTSIEDAVSLRCLVYLAWLEIELKYTCRLCDYFPEKTSPNKNKIFKRNFVLKHNF